MTTPRTLLLHSLRRRAVFPLMIVYWLMAGTGQARASFLQGETLDKVADILSWVVIVIVPVVGIAVFWLVHILPEKVAEKRRHPQAKAIQCLCLLSLFFGGLLWPIAWLWAYSKPVLYKIAYGKDEEDHHDTPAVPEPMKPAAPAVADTKTKKEGGQS